MKKTVKIPKDFFCVKCGRPNDTKASMCSECLHKNRLNRYKSYGREDLKDELHS